MTLPTSHTDWSKYTKGISKSKNKPSSITNPEFLFDKHIAPKITPWRFPDNPFDYVGFLNDFGIGKAFPKLANDASNKKIAIVGAGAAGLSATYELLKAYPQLDITIFEATDRIGGRLYSKPFPPYGQNDIKSENNDDDDDDDDDEDDKNDILINSQRLSNKGKTRTGPMIEIGAMRFPPSHKLFTHYRDKFGLDHDPFPNPHVVHTVMNYGGVSYTWLASESSPPGPFRAVREKLGMILNPILNKLYEIWEDPEARSREWQKVIDKYENKSFYNALAETGLFTESEMAIFGALGVGTGGFRGLYRVNFIELIRIELGKWDKEQVLIKTGSQTLTDEFYARAKEYSKDRLKIHYNTPVTAISKPEKDGRIILYTSKNAGQEQPISPATRREKYISGDKKLGPFDAVILTPTTHAIQMNMHIEEGIFEPAVSQSIRNVHLMNSTKLAIHPRPEFWKKAKELGMAPVVLTDLAIGQSYCLDYGEMKKKDEKDEKDEKYEEDLFLDGLVDDIENNSGFPSMSSYPHVKEWSEKIFETKLAALSTSDRNRLNKNEVEMDLLKTGAAQDAIKRFIQTKGLPTKEGVIFLSYAWGEDSTKLASRSLYQAVNLAVDNLKEIYKDYPDLPDLFDKYLRPKATHNVDTNLPDPQMEWVNWEREEFTVGAFKLNYSGQQEDVLRLYYQYAGYDPVAHKDYDPSGVFLAGDGVSWCGGWVEGALHTGLNAALAVCNFLTPNSSDEKYKNDEDDDDDTKKESKQNENNQQKTTINLSANKKGVKDTTVDID